MGAYSNQIAALWLMIVAESCAHPGQPQVQTGQPQAQMGQLLVQPGRPAKRGVASATPCQKDNVPDPRGRETQGDLLWGIKRRVKDRPESGNRFEQVQLGGLQVEGTQLRGIAEKGEVLISIAADGERVQLAVCGGETAAEDRELRWYNLQYWDDASQSWENPCAGTEKVPVPRALALRDVWDGTGSRHASATMFTFACENGVMTKCVKWGYKPWKKRSGKSLVDYHQACTRMARADYCGNGKSHTKEGTVIDMYDDLGIQTRMAAPAGEVDPGTMSFEAAWTPDGAYCLDRSRYGGVDEIMKECPDRFSSGSRQDLGQGDSCAVSVRERAAGAVMLRNRSFPVVDR